MSATELKNMLKFLQEEEKYLNNVVKFMDQEHIRLQIEELGLKAALRREKMKVYDTGYKHNNKTSEVGPETDRLQPSPSKLQKKKKTDHVPNSIDTFNKAQSNPTPVMVPEIKSEFSNITDDRYLEPLCLKYNGFDDSELIEYD